MSGNPSIHLTRGREEEEEEEEERKNQPRENIDFSTVLNPANALVTDLTCPDALNVVVQYSYQRDVQ
jgi:hypothetical protein